MNRVWIALLLHVGSILGSALVTGETHQVTLLPNFLLGWSRLENDTFRFTVRLESSKRSWLALGTTTSVGLGSSPMITSSGAVIGKPGVLNVGFQVKEYALVGKSSQGVIPWVTKGPSILEITRCVTKACPEAASRCQTSATCGSALRCTSSRLASGVTNNTLELFNECVPDGISQDANGLGAFLETAGCFLTNCARDLKTDNQRVSNIDLVSSSQTVTDEESFITQFTFIAKQIGNVQLASKERIVFIAAYGEGNIVKNHGPNNRAAVSLRLNVDSATTQVPLLDPQPLPFWVWAHVILMTLGLGLFIPMGICVKTLRIRNHCVLHPLLQFVGLLVSLIGVILPAFFVLSVGSEVHHILGIATMVLLFMQPLSFSFYPRPPATEEEEFEHKHFVQEWHKFHFLMAFLVLILAIVTGFMGYTLLQSKTRLVDIGQISLVPIVLASSIGLALATSVLFTIVRYRKGGGQGTGGANKQMTTTNPQFQTNQAINELRDEEDAAKSEPLAKPQISVTPTLLCFQNVSYRALDKKQSYWNSTKKHTKGKLILEGCSGFCSPGTLTAIMGPSGSGKTSLLDLLAGRARQAPEHGSIIEVNGVPIWKETTPLKVGYVLQEDVLHQYLTVYETLSFTADLILPSLPPRDRVERITRVVAQLGLSHCLHTKVGGIDVRGLSGGERRRVSVGIQLLSSPSLLFLDECTSGLDSSTAKNLIESLRDLANDENRTIVTTIHQPNKQVFDFFDRLILLSQGKLIWSGNRVQCENFFAMNSFPVPSRWNAADWYLLVVNVPRPGDEQEADGVDTASNETSYQLPTGLVASTAARTNRAANVSRKANLVVNDQTLRMSVTAESRKIDISEFHEAVKSYYLVNNPDKLRNNPEIVDEVVRYGLVKGLAKLDEKLINTYGGQGISPSLSQGTRFSKINRDDYQCATLEQLNKLVSSFASSLEAAEIESRAQRAREESALTTWQSEQETDLENGGAHQTSNKSGITHARLGTQITILSHRSLVLTWRDPQALRFQAIQNFVFGLVLGSLYSSLSSAGQSPRAYALSMAMAMVIGMVSMVTVALNTQVVFNDKIVFEREQMDDFYSPVSHFLARLIIGIPTGCIVAACLILPAYWWIGLRSDFNSFIFFFLVSLSMIFLFDGLASVTVFIAKDMATAYGIGNFYVAIASFVSGIFIPFPLIPVFWSWLYFVTPFSYAYAAVALNEFLGSEQEFWLTAIGIYWFNKWGNLLVVVFMGLGWRLLGLVLAMRIQALSRKNLKPKND